MKLKWEEMPEGAGRMFTLIGEFTDRDGRPFYFAQAWRAAERETERLRRDQHRAEREIGKEWQRQWNRRVRVAEKLGLNVRDVPVLGDAVLPGHVFGVDWSVTVRDGVVVSIDITRRRDGSPRTPVHLS